MQRTPRHIGGMGGVVEQHPADDAQAEKISRHAIDRDFGDAPQFGHHVGAAPRDAAAIRLHAEEDHEGVGRQRRHRGEDLAQRAVGDVADRNGLAHAADILFGDVEIPAVEPRGAAHDHDLTSGRMQP